MTDQPTSQMDRLARFGAMFDAAPIGITIVDADGRLIDCNPAFAAMLRYSVDELRGRHFGSLSAPGEAEENLRKFREMVSGQCNEFTVEKSYVRRDGETIWVRLTSAPVRDETGAFEHAFGMVEDITERRRMRQALRESEQLHRSILESLPVIAYRAEINPPYRPTFVSAGAESLGYPLEEWFGPEHIWFNRMHPDDRALVLEEAALARQSGRPIDIEYRLLAPDGTERWFHDKGMFVRDEQGRPEAWQGVMLDVTDRHKTEDALRSSEALFRSITENVADLISIIDAAGRFSYVNRAVERTLGWAAEEIVGKSLLEFVHPDDVAVTGEVLSDILREPGRRGGLRLRMRHQIGEWRVIDAAGTNMLHHPNINGVVGTSRDVTDQIKIEQDLRFQAHVLDVVDQAVVVTDAAGLVVYWNKRAESLFGWNGEQILGKDYVSIAYPEPGDDDRVRFDRLRRGEAIAPRERTLRRLDGSRFLASIAPSPIYDDKGNAVGIVAIITDISERRQLEEQLRQSQKLEAIGQLAGGVAHDFNNILTVISGRAEFLKAATPGSDDWREDVDEVLAASSRASRLTRQLLAFSRKQMMQLRVLSLDEVVKDLAPMLQRLIGEDIELVLQIGEAARNVLADPGQLEQILVNLIVNARDAMPHGGVLVVGIRLDALTARSEVARKHEAKPGEYMVLSVSDTGLGMDEATTSRVFEPFFTTKEPGRGTGLGLSTVYGVVKQSGGFITVRSKPMAGTTFDVYFPAIAEDSPIASGGAAASSESRGHETILVVEDSDPVRLIAARVLKQQGYHVLTARNGAEALQLAASHREPIDLLLTDVVMPRMSGRQLSETLCAQRPGLRTLFMSGYTDDVIIRKGLDLPGVSFLEKPFTSAALARRVRELLDTDTTRSAAPARRDGGSRS